MMSMKGAHAWLWARGWPVSSETLRAAFPDGSPATTRDLREWAERTLPRPVLPPRPIREPSLTPADAADLLTAAGYTVTGADVGRAAKRGEIRLTRAGGLMEGEVRCWARRNLPQP